MDEAGELRGKVRGGKGTFRQRSIWVSESKAREDGGRHRCKQRGRSSRHLDWDPLKEMLTMSPTPPCCQLRQVYKTSILVFRDRDAYVTGDRRFSTGYGKSNPRQMVKARVPPHPPARSILVLTHPSPAPWRRFLSKAVPRLFPATP